VPAVAHPVLRAHCLPIACLQVKKAFSERRKMLRNTLQPLYSTQQVRPPAATLLRGDDAVQHLLPLAAKAHQADTNKGWQVPGTPVAQCLRSTL